MSEGHDNIEANGFDSTIKDEPVNDNTTNENAGLASEEYDNINTSETATENLKNENHNIETKENEDDDNRKLFVGGLSWETTEEDVKTYFETWGPVSSCTIKIDKMTGNSRGFGFVTMETEECMRKILSAGEHRIKNKKIDPKAAKPTKEPIKKIFVGGLPSEVSEEQIREYFSQYGTVETVDLPFDTQKGKRKPYVFLSFSTEEAAKNAISTEKQDVCGSKCDVRMAVPKEQANKNKMAAWAQYSAPGTYPGAADYYSYEYPYAGAYSYDNANYYQSGGYYNAYPCYSYPMPPQPYVAPRRGAPTGAGKMNNPRGRGGNPGFHPYARPQ